MTTTMNEVKATDKQIAYINDLLNSRVAPAELQALTIDLLSRADASQVIETLLASPRKSVSGRTENTNVLPNTAPINKIPVGIYTVEHGDGTHTTLKFSEEAWADNKIIVAVLTGPNNELNYTKFGFLTEQGVKKWASKQVSEKTLAAVQYLLTGGVDKARETFLAQAEAHAFESGNCLACLKTLTVPASRHRGLGPVCAKRLGVL